MSMNSFERDRFSNCTFCRVLRIIYYLLLFFGSAFATFMTIYIVNF
jgi:hypothetical protein